MNDPQTDPQTDPLVVPKGTQKNDPKVVEKKEQEQTLYDGGPIPKFNPNK
jgi:hypothetical protein